MIVESHKLEKFCLSGHCNFGTSVYFIEFWIKKNQVRNNIIYLPKIIIVLSYFLVRENGDKDTKFCNVSCST